MTGVQTCALPIFISRNFENGDYAVLIKHVDPRYEYGYEYMGIYNFNSVEVAKERHKIMLEVMAGERLIPDERKYRSNLLH